ncbi:MAG: DNA-processing protein DprA [Candidatus Omnitrophica bacterium]|nr:DNA-processing protein DprA [Candidatus Omnitrophota bacterium]MCM8826275.1 DNA-processing protein DprA [Candidatus Omnitrophota bacterium]
MDKLPWLILNRGKVFSLREIEAIGKYFPHPKDILKAKTSDFLSIGLKNREVEKILEFRDSQDLGREIKLIEKNGISIVDFFDDDYPPLLREIEHPPLVLYLKGDKKVLKEFCFAIVGTRLPTLYGLAMAEKFSFSLAGLGIVIVSGLAKGIDTAVHKGALRGGRTIAVLGSGLLNIYPKENKNLAEDIIVKGAVISEFPLEEPPLKENFPRRNRIISGLSKGVLVVEAALKSGALITARYALEQNREVFAIPGKADSPLSEGTHLLIKEGAKLVDSLKDVLEELDIEWEEKKEEIIFTPEEKIVFDIIDREGLFLEEVILKSGLERGKINRAILSLQLRGLITEKTPGYFVRKI